MRRTMVNSARLDFLVGDETVECIGKGVKWSLLSQPWSEVAYYIEKYLTC